MKNDTQTSSIGLPEPALKPSRQHAADTSLESESDGLERDGVVEVLLDRMRDDVLHVSTVLVDQVVGERRLRQRVHVCTHTSHRPRTNVPAEISIHSLPLHGTE